MISSKEDLQDGQLYLVTSIYKTTNDVIHRYRKDVDRFIELSSHKYYDGSDLSLLVIIKYTKLMQVIRGI